MILDLPYPPTANTYYRNVRGKTLISAGGRVYRQLVALACREQDAGAVPGRLSVLITAYPPDRRRRDMDNLLKPTLDSLQHAGVFPDDANIDQLAITRGAVRPGGGLLVVNVQTIL